MDIPKSSVWGQRRTHGKYEGESGRMKREEEDFKGVFPGLCSSSKAVWLGVGQMLGRERGGNAREEGKPRNGKAALRYGDGKTNRQLRFRKHDYLTPSMRT